MQDVLELKPVQRLQGLLKDRYGVGLRLAWISDVTEIQAAQSSVQKREGALHIPITKNTKYFGSVFITDSKHLNEQDCLLVSHLVKLVMEPTLYGHYVKHFNQEPLTQENRENVVPLVKPQWEHPLLFVESALQEKIHRVALDVHDVTQNWAFVHYKDVAPSLQSAKDFLEMSGTTLWTDGFSRLSEQELQNIIHMLRYQQQGPFLVLGINGSESKEDWSSLHKSFFTTWKFLHLEVDKVPSGGKNLRNVIELFLEPATEV